MRIAFGRERWEGSAPARLRLLTAPHMSLPLLWLNVRQRMSLPTLTKVTASYYQLSKQTRLPRRLRDCTQARVFIPEQSGLLNAIERPRRSRVYRHSRLA